MVSRVSQEGPKRDVSCYVFRLSFAVRATPPKMTPRCPQNDIKGPAKIIQNGSSKRLRWSQDAPPDSRIMIHLFLSPFVCPKTPKKSPIGPKRLTQDVPKKSQDTPKMASRVPQNGPKMSPAALNCRFPCAQCLQDSPKSPP